MEKTTKIIGSTYEILEEIGSGGGGIVYLGNHIRLGKKVVLKADKRKITTHQELLKKEVNVLKELSNDYIPQVYDFFEEDGVVYTVIDYVPGESLDKPLKRGEKFSQAQIITWAKQVLNALVYLHDPSKHGDPPKGYIHSDIKPANIMRRPDNSICLIDFNIALALGEPNIRAWLGNTKTAIWTLILLAIWQFGSSMLIFLSALKQIPSSLYEAADVDGANKFTKFFKVTLPLLTPTIFFNLVMQMINGFLAFTQSLIITQGKPMDTTLFYALYMYQQSFQFNNAGYASAMAWMMLLLIGTFTLVLFKTKKYWVYDQG